MTPIEIIKAWREGKKLETINCGDEAIDAISGVKILLELSSGYSHTIDIDIKDIDWIRIKRETFGFFKAINTMR